MDVATPYTAADRLSIAYEELDAIILREGLDMFRQLLARLIPTRHPFRVSAMQATEAGTPELPCHTVLGEVYRAHAAIHGPNQLLPEDALPHPSERPRTSEVRGSSELT